MGYWSLCLLILSLTFLAYKNQAAAMDYLPRWLRPAEKALPLEDKSFRDTPITPPPAESTHISANLIQEEIMQDEQRRDTSPYIVVPSLEESQPDNETTPKAMPEKVATEIPSFNLDESHSLSEKISDKPAVISSALASSTQPKVTMPPPAKPVTVSAPKPQSGLMPPPTGRVPALRPPQSPASSLRVPTTGPLPNRGPPQSQAAQARSGLSPYANTVNQRNKVLLAPGHSPLDWATLSQSKNLSDVPTFQRVTPSMLKEHNGRKGRPAWSSYLGKVYNIKPYLPFHPGGEGELLRCAGKDGGKLFMEAHPWVNWENMLNSCLVGVMVSEGDGEGLDEMD